MATPSRTPLRAPPFIRQLARLAQSVAPPLGPALPDHLSHWTDWSRAVALSRALDGIPPPIDPAPPAPEDATDEEACDRARTRLIQAIAADEGAGAVTGDDYTPFQQRYVSLQRAMLTATGRLRGRLRDALARQSPELARLAEVDAVMERVLSPREQTLLASVPVVLGQHFTRLRQAAHEASSCADASTSAASPATPPGDPPEPAPPPASTAWLDAFRRDMRQLLLAELEFRFHPLEGLLAALRAQPQPQGCHVQKYA